MFYAREHFELIAARRLLENHQRWLSGNGRSKKGEEYVANEITYAFMVKHQVCIGWTMREGGAMTADDNSQVILEVNFLSKQPYARVEQLIPPDKEILVLKREFEPGRDKD